MWKLCTKPIATASPNSIDQPLYLYKIHHKGDFKQNLRLVSPGRLPTVYVQYEWSVFNIFLSSKSWKNFSFVTKHVHRISAFDKWFV